MRTIRPPRNITIQRIAQKTAPSHIKGVVPPGFGNPENCAGRPTGPEGCRGFRS